MVSFSHELIQCASSCVHCSKRFSRKWNTCSGAYFSHEQFECVIFWNYFSSLVERVMLKDRYTEYDRIRLHTTAYNRIRPHTTAYDRIRPHTAAYDPIRPHTTTHSNLGHSQVLLGAPGHSWALLGAPGCPYALWGAPESS